MNTTDTLYRSSVTTHCNVRIALKGPQRMVDSMLRKIPGSGHYRLLVDHITYVDSVRRFAYVLSDPDLLAWAAKYDAAKQRKIWDTVAATYDASAAGVQSFIEAPDNYREGYGAYALTTYLEALWWLERLGRVMGRPEAAKASELLERARQVLLPKLREEYPFRDTIAAQVSLRLYDFPPPQMWWFHDPKIGMQLFSNTPPMKR